ncbi:MAG: O-antigen ligase family protein [Lacrimispora sp.]|uniref:O-antigen ligase family protein n=1 Tax=Lacrimispora sp. TaxID=2719234 RepID=UPI0039E4EAFD
MKIKLANEKGTYLTMILGIYVVLIGVGLPIVVKNAYFDILAVKYYFYCICTGLMLVLLLVYFLTARRETILHCYKDFSVKNLIKKANLLDCSILSFLLVSLISTLSSDYLYESFWGNEGRFTGFFLLSLYVISYFCVSKFWRYQNYYINLILITGCFVSIFGITDYFQMDIFRFKAFVMDKQKLSFTSTIGNINTYTAYVGIIAAIATVLFAASVERKKTVFYYLCMIITFFAIIMGASDNAYISLATLFVFLPLYLFSNKKGIQSYLIVLATFFSVIKVIDWINFYFKNTVRRVDGIFTVIADSKLLLYWIAALWGLILIWCIIDYITKSRYKEYGNIFRYIWLTLIFAVIIFIVYIMYDCNILGNIESYEKYGSYFIFNDQWGTHRGYIWRNAIEQFGEFTIWKKIFGFGPETFGILLMRRTYGNPYNEIFDSAHNEYLQYLLTIGIAGLISYIILILSYIKKCFSYKNRNPYIIAIVFGVICYSAQAFVNLGLPIITPILWLLLAMGGSKSIESNNILMEEN